MAYQLKITLKDVKPAVWRRIQVSEHLTLLQLHEAVQAVMGWQNYHLHQFIIGGARFATPSPEDERNDKPIDERRTKLKDVSGHRSFEYEYDFGDGWEHEIVIEKVLDEELPSPVLCIDGKRACPPEDCGGPWGYEETLRIVNDPKDPEHKERVEWIGGKFDPEQFSVALANQALVLRGPLSKAPSAQPRLRPQRRQSRR
jgi:hypothetical protein